MKDIGRKSSVLFETMQPSKDEKIYPSVNIPVDFFGKGYKVGDTCNIEFVAKIKFMDEKSVGLELQKAEEVESAADEKKEDEK